jgi:Raf kinase inhibitor-like YbhB/YbcL family protein
MHPRFVFLRALLNVIALLLGISVGFLVGAINSGGARADSTQQPAHPPSKFKLAVSGYADGGTIPVDYSCAAPAPTSPALQWSGAPEGTVAFAVIFHDVDTAPAKGSMDVTHWIFWNVPAGTTQIPAGVPPGTASAGMVQGKNIRGVNGFQPSCPPPGSVPHHYIYEIYALDTKLDLPADSSRADLLKAMDGHVIGKAAYVGVFSR